MNIIYLFLLGTLLCLIAVWLGVVWMLYSDDPNGPRTAVADEVRQIKKQLGEQHMASVRKIAGGK